MRILIVNSEYPPVGGGAGNASANIAREFVRMGEEVAVLTTRYQDLPIDEVEDGIRIHRCISVRKEVSRSNPWEQLSFLLGACTDGLLFLKKWKPDVLITFFGVPSGPVGLLAKTLFRIPYIVSLRGGDVPGFRPYDFSTYHKLISPLLRLVWRRADDVVANSEGLRKLAKAFAPQIPVSVIPNGVDVELFRPDKRDWDPPHMLFVGRIVYQKGLDVLIEALSDLKDQPWKLTLVGDGPQLEPLKLEAQQNGLLDRITFPGWVDRSDLIDFYHQANLFVFPSRHEGMPNAVLEAMASGLPVIASQIAGNQELISDGKTGYLIPVENSKAIADKLLVLFMSKDLKEKMGEAAQERVQSRYSWKNTALKYKDLVQELHLESHNHS